MATELDWTTARAYTREEDEAITHDLCVKAQARIDAVKTMTEFNKLRDAFDDEATKYSARHEEVRAQVCEDPAYKTLLGVEGEAGRKLKAVERTLPPERSYEQEKADAEVWADKNVPKAWGDTDYNRIVDQYRYSSGQYGRNMREKALDEAKQAYDNAKHATWGYMSERADIWHSLAGEYQSRYLRGEWSIGWLGHRLKKKLADLKEDALERKATKAGMKVEDFEPTRKHEKAVEDLKELARKAGEDAEKARWAGVKPVAPAFPDAVNKTFEEGC